LVFFAVLCLTNEFFINSTLVKEDNFILYDQNKELIDVILMNSGKREQSDFT
jgi:hypothetical protein